MKVKILLGLFILVNIITDVVCLIVQYKCHTQTDYFCMNPDKNSIKDKDKKLGSVFLVIHSVCLFGYTSVLIAYICIGFLIVRFLKNYDRVLY